MRASLIVRGPHVEREFLGAFETGMLLRPLAAPKTLTLPRSGAAAADALRAAFEQLAALLNPETHLRSPLARLFFEAACHLGVLLALHFTIASSAFAAPSARARASCTPT